MDSDTWSFIQHVLIFVFEPVIGYWLTSLAAAGILAALYMLILGLLRWLTGRGSLI
jgi:hypothetical protein